MFVLVTYDVNVVSKKGTRRLAKVAKLCQDYGQRVQNSVFECVLSESDFLVLRASILRVIDKETDSVRFYRLSGNWERKVEQIGKKTSLNVTEPLLI